MSSKQHEVKHLHEQPWYDYETCLHAVKRADQRWRFEAGAIFAVKVAALGQVEPVHQVYALKLHEGGEPAQRYRMCLYPKPLVAQRVLRGLDEPPKKPAKGPDDPYIRKGQRASYVI